MSNNKISTIWDSVVRNLSWAMCRVMPVNNKKIVISSYYGRGYGDNPKYIVEELLERNEDVKIIWGIPLSTGAKSIYYDRGPGAVLL